MVLSTNFHKIAKNALNTKIRALTKTEKKDLYESLVRKKIFLNLLFCVVAGWIGAVEIVILFASVLSSAF